MSTVCSHRGGFPAPTIVAKFDGGAEKQGIVCPGSGIRVEEWHSVGCDGEVQDYWTYKGKDGVSINAFDDLRLTR